MKSFYEKYQRNYFSQNGEDGIIEECLKRIGIEKGNCCEIGAHDGIFCSNTYNLRKNKGWYGMLVEADQSKWGELLKNATENSNSVCAFASEKNINTLIAPHFYNVLSIDIDGPDYWVWQAYDPQPEHDPDIVIIEINSSLQPLEKHVSDENGASFYSMLQLGWSKGYFLLCHTGNLIFIRNDHRHLFPEIVGDGLENWHEYFQTKWLSV